MYPARASEMQTMGSPQSCALPNLTPFADPIVFAMSDFDPADPEDDDDELAHAEAPAASGQALLSLPQAHAAHAVGLAPQQQLLLPHGITADDDTAGGLLADDTFAGDVDATPFEDRAASLNGSLEVVLAQVNDHACLRRLPCGTYHTCSRAWHNMSACSSWTILSGVRVACGMHGSCLFRTV